MATSVPPRQRVQLHGPAKCTSTTPPAARRPHAHCGPPSFLLRPAAQGPRHEAPEVQPPLRERGGGLRQEARCVPALLLLLLIAMLLGLPADALVVLLWRCLLLPA